MSTNLNDDSPPRQVPHFLLDKMKQCIEANLRCGVLKRVDRSTDWVHNLVIVEKRMVLSVCA